nr:MAG TPA: hypothetical protein [Caudoviricetes sp.]
MLWDDPESYRKHRNTPGMLLLSSLCSEIWQGGRRRRGKAKFNG